MLKLEKLYKSESAIEILQEAILSGGIKGGTEITQTEAAESLGVSRMPVREALISLEYCGLLERLPGQHVRVVNFDEEIIKNIFHDAAILVGEIIKNFNPEKIHELLLLIEKENQIEFHKNLIKKTKSPLRKKFLEIFSEIYLSFVLKYSENLEDINAKFKKFLAILVNFNQRNLVYNDFYNYYSILADELIKIRKRNGEKN